MRSTRYWENLAAAVDQVISFGLNNDVLDGKKIADFLHKVRHDNMEWQNALDSTGCVFPYEEGQHTGTSATLGLGGQQRAPGNGGRGEGHTRGQLRYREIPIEQPKVRTCEVQQWAGFTGNILRCFVHDCHVISGGGIGAEAFCPGQIKEQIAYLDWATKDLENYLAASLRKK